ncbi:MAG: hypothetical protein DHS20C16_18850 [Phycisphaerae bacterium]|nr:MAG: hypothetical protein DHS20C16_18850 [Phycisphaerae bacterium]
MNKCPRCSYSLEGLPEIHACPECGLHYNGETTYVELKPSKTSWKMIAIVAVLTSWIAFDPGVRPKWIGVLFICFWSVMLVTTVGLHAYRLRQAQKGQLIIDWLGIRLVRPNGGTETILISDIRRAKYSSMMGRLSVIGWDDQKLLTIPQWQLGSEQSVIDLAHKINRLVA